MQQMLADNRAYWESGVNSDIADRHFFETQANLLSILAEKLVTPHMTLLDVGCGDGRNTQILAKYCRRIIGFELAEKLLEEAKRKHAVPNGEYVQLDLEAEEWELPHAADRIFCLGVLCTIHNWQSILRILHKFHDALGPDGLLITRDRLSDGPTYTKTHACGYCGIYRSERHYRTPFEKTGFTRELFIPIDAPLFGYHIFRKAD